MAAKPQPSALLAVEPIPLPGEARLLQQRAARRVSAAVASQTSFGERVAQLGRGRADVERQRVLLALRDELVGRVEGQPPAAQLFVLKSAHDVVSSEPATRRDPITFGVSIAWVHEKGFARPGRPRAAIHRARVPGLAVRLPRPRRPTK
jgi:hypothetical protein